MESKLHRRLDQFLSIIQLKVVDNKVIEQLVTEDLIDSQFELRYLYGNRFGLFVKIMIDGSQAFIVIEEGGLPYRAEFVSDFQGTLRSFKFMCQGCFGEDADCGVCGGTGWGVL